MSLTFAQTTLLALFVCILNAPSKGQTQWLPLQKISLKDKVLQRNLYDYAKITKAEFIEVRLNKHDSFYHYELTVVSFYESIERYSLLSWGQWGRCILLFTSKKQSELNEVLAVSDTCSLNNLARYAQPLLPNQTTITRLEGGIIQSDTYLSHGLNWEFVVKGGQEL